MKQLIGLNNIKYELNQLKDIPHILLYGPRGCGKSTIAKYIAQIKNKKLHFVTGNTLKKQDLLNLLINVEENDIICIDEIHRMTAAVEEILYNPMENFQLPIKGTSGQFQVFTLPKFSLIGTTTKPSSINKPLISRFQISLQIPHYSLRELTRIIISNYEDISVRNALNIAINTIVPREAINLAYRIVSLCKNDLNKEINKILEFIGYKYGLSKSERFYLKIVYNVGKIGLSNLASALQLDEDEVRYIEEKLIRKGYIQISSRGRCLSVKGLLKIKEMKK